jgi:hypothetical protein
MAGYRHYLLDGAGNISRATWLDASNDEEAIQHVRQQQLRFPSEIWKGNRLIGRVGTTSPADCHGALNVRGTIIPVDKAAHLLDFSPLPRE